MRCSEEVTAQPDRPAIWNWYKAIEYLRKVNGIQIVETSGQFEHLVNRLLVAWTPEKDEHSMVKQDLQRDKKNGLSKLTREEAMKSWAVVINSTLTRNLWLQLFNKEDATKKRSDRED
ncbi:hypothetical protein AVEN_49606-1 [Araneus ventricosus]|uniref:Uncharacterized protein n=1 Tax=Araneus ventricosus TaxID=182803 RepID=A0A4Y2IE25_ARAVE|nr:hypothetical protein AVEN_49606-1 [Araneus ventricosus]